MIMPNWCENKLTISHEDTDVIDNLMAQVRADDNGNLFNYIKPMPENTFRGMLGENERKECKEKGIPNWYDWSFTNWGTKWDAAHLDWHQLDEHTVEFNFDTAWSPPIPVYEALAEQGYQVEAYYLEYGVGFAGQWHFDGEFYQDESVSIYKEQIPTDIDEVFGITEQLSEWAAEKKETA